MPEVFIQMEIVNEKEEYFFRKYEDVSALLNDDTFNFLDYMHIKKYLMPIIEKCRELKPFLTPNFPLTPPLEFFAFNPNIKGSSEIRKYTTKKPTFNIMIGPKCKIILNY